MPFGIPQSSWDAAKNEALSILIKRASLGKAQPISYSELASKISSVKFDANDNRFHALLGEVACDEDDEDRGLISVLVIHKGGDMRPGQGFFDLAKERGRVGVDDEQIWINEFELVDASWPN